MANNGKIFLALLSYVRGRGTADDLIRSSKRISDVSEFEKPGESIIDIEFDSEKIMEYLGLYEDDIYLYNNINSPYSEFGPIDEYTVKENFLEGYDVYSTFNEESFELLSQISKLLLGKKIDFDDITQVSELNQKMFEHFRDECEDIIQDYTSEINIAIRDKMRDKINNDVNDALDKLDFKLINLEKIRIRAADLLSYFLEYNATHLNISQLFEKIFSKYQIEGGWYEDSYEYQYTTDFDTESYNNYAQRKLTNIIDKISSDMEDEDKKKYYELIDRISKKFPTNKKLPVPKTKKYNFLILGFEKEGPKIVIKLINNENRETKIITLTEENFNHLLYQPTLFDFDDM